MNKQSLLRRGLGLGGGRGLGIGGGRGLGIGAGLPIKLGPRMDATGPHGRGLGPGGGLRTGGGLALREALSKQSEYLQEIHDEAFNDELEKISKLGEGMGVGGPAQQIGGTNACVCPSCGHEVPHVRGKPCTTRKCPKCGTKMKGKGA